VANETVRSLPSNVEAEQYILGAVLFNNECISDVMEQLKIQDFYLEQHKRIYEAMVNLSNRGEPIELPSLKDALETSFDSIGGAEYLTQLRLMVTTTATLRSNVEIVKNKSVLRKLIRASTEIIDMGYHAESDISVILNSAESKIFDILQNRTSSDLTPIGEILADNVARLEKMLKDPNKNKITGVPTGFKELDNRTAGLQPSDLILIAARPAMGKTSFAINIATNAAMRYNVPVAIFSLEMSKEQLTNRILSSEAYIESEKMRVADLSPDEWPRLATAGNSLSKAPIYIDDTPGITVSEIRAKCRRLKLKNKWG